MIMNQRELRFPTLASKVYLSSGSYGLLSTDVEAAYLAYLADRKDRGADWVGWGERVEQVREKLARLIGASPGEIALTGSASEGLNALASALPLGGERKRILVSSFEFPTTAQICHAQRARGAEIVMVPIDPDGSDAVERFEAMIDERTALVVATHVCYRNGVKLDVGRIAATARRYGALSLVDCYQSVGAEMIDVKALGVDFAVGGMLKYLLASAGMGFLYVDGRHLGSLYPVSTGWFAQGNPHAMDIAANDPAPDARRFQSGTPPVPIAYAAEASLGLLEEFGKEAIDARIRHISGACIDRLADAGISVTTPRSDDRRGPLVAIPSPCAPALVDALAQHDVVVTARDGNIRAGFHFYNDESDITRFIAALNHHRDLLTA